MKDRKQQDGPSPNPQTPPTNTRDAISSDQIQIDADEMADQANRSEQTFDANHGIFDKI